ncbi:MAG TPA: DNA alkylation repair protein [Nitriliruptorales bacterium]|nr:DNA alkylation repair protein [Nitriliruptorales bacterium]
MSEDGPGVVGSTAHTETWADALVAELSAVATHDRAVHERAYLKSNLEFLGASVPDIRRVATRFHREHPTLSDQALRGLVQELWGRRIHELRMVAVELLKLYRDRLTPDDAPMVEGLVRESRTWALVDGLAASVTGALVDAHPSAMETVIRLWGRTGTSGFDGRAFSRTYPACDTLQATSTASMPSQTRCWTRESFIRKAIGWVLREAGKHRPDEVVAWLEPRLDRASGITVREAVKHLPDHDRRRLLGASVRRVSSVARQLPMTQL